MLLVPDILPDFLPRVLMFAADESLVSKVCLYEASSKFSKAGVTVPWTVSERVMHWCDLLFESYKEGYQIVLLDYFKLLEYIVFTFSEPPPTDTNSYSTFKSLRDNAHHLLKSLVNNLQTTAVEAKLKNNPKCQEILYRFFAEYEGLLSLWVRRMQKNIGFTNPLLSSLWVIIIELGGTVLGASTALRTYNAVFLQIKSDLLMKDEEFGSPNIIVTFRRAWNSSYPSAFRNSLVECLEKMTELELPELKNLLACLAILANTNEKKLLDISLISTTAHFLLPYFSRFIKLGHDKKMDEETTYIIQTLLSRLSKSYVPSYSTIFDIEDALDNMAMVSCKSTASVDRRFPMLSLASLSLTNIVVKSGMWAIFADILLQHAFSKEKEIVGIAVDERPMISASPEASLDSLFDAMRKEAMKFRQILSQLRCGNGLSRNSTGTKSSR
ncbi:hypothetical protein BC829DRAFT_86492 [Chytridium lagenaria]|nr:hypothetical protein BC829DRAFT_86492 [Chytridium lagenaria]